MKLDVLKHGLRLLGRRLMADRARLRRNWPSRNLIFQ